PSFSAPHPFPTGNHSVNGKQHVSEPQTANHPYPASPLWVQKYLKNSSSPYIYPGPFSHAVCFNLLSEKDLSTHHSNKVWDNEKQKICPEVEKVITEGITSNIRIISQKLLHNYCIK